MKAKWLIGIVAALALGVLTLPVILESDRHDTPMEGGSCSQGTANLDLTLKDADGRDVKLADYKGKVVLLNFWATWCGPCLLEIPDFIKVYEEQKDKGFVVLGVLTEDSVDGLKKFVEDKKMTYPIAVNTPEVEDAYGPIYGLPMSVLIARDGSVCKRHFGPLSKEQLEKELKSLL